MTPWTPWTARSNQSILKKIGPEYSLAGQMLKLKLQFFGHLMERTDSLEKTLMLGKIEGRRRRGWQRMGGWTASPTWRTWVWASWELVMDREICCSPWGCKELDMTEWLNWTESIYRFGWKAITQIKINSTFSFFMKMQFLSCSSFHLLNCYFVFPFC